MNLRLDLSRWRPLGRRRTGSIWVRAGIGLRVGKALGESGASGAFRVSMCPKTICHFLLMKENYGNRVPAQYELEKFQTMMFGKLANEIPPCCHHDHKTLFKEERSPHWAHSIVCRMKSSLWLKSTHRIILRRDSFRPALHLLVLQCFC